MVNVFTLFFKKRSEYTFILNPLNQDIHNKDIGELLDSMNESIFILI